MVAAADESGYWPIEYVKHKWGFTSTGAEQIGVLFNVTDGPLKGRSFVWYGSWSEAALPMTYDALTAIGWEGKALPTLRTDLKRGARAIGNFGYETYDGKTRLRLNFVNRARDIVFTTAMVEKDFHALGARVHKLIDKGVHVRKGDEAGSTGAGAERDEDDDIPF